MTLESFRKFSDYNCSKNLIKWYNNYLNGAIEHDSAEWGIMSGYNWNSSKCDGIGIKSKITNFEIKSNFKC